MDQASLSPSAQEAVAPPTPPHEHEADPLFLSAAIALSFGALAAVRLTIPSAPYFDEVHYIPAAKDLLAGGIYRNQEHPLLAKELIALAIAAFGDTPLGWRLAPLIAGTVAVFASMRALWFASESRFASLAFGLLLASGFHLFVQSRIAMLDIFMVGFLAIAAWQFAAAIKEPEKGRLRLAMTGVALGCALASKWNAIPLAVLPGLAFLVARIAADRRRPIASTRGIPVPGISLWEAGLWLVILPLVIYLATFLPAWNLEQSPLPSLGIFGMQEYMLSLQTQVLKSHPYESTLSEWVLNWRAIWYLYEDVDGAQRGIMMIGNPVTMLLGLPALIWCAVSGISQRNWLRLAIAAGYLASIGLWLVADKSVQFYYHYVLPGCFLLAALSLSLQALWNHGRKLLAAGVIALSLAIFAWFYPILSAAPLEDRSSFAKWTWIESWR